MGSSQRRIIHAFASRIVGHGVRGRCSPSSSTAKDPFAPSISVGQPDPYGAAGADVASLDPPTFDLACHFCRARVSHLGTCSTKMWAKASEVRCRWF